MKLLFCILVGVAVLISGCTVPELPTVSADSPANPDAQAAPLLQPSTLIVVPDDVDSTAVPTSQPTMPTSHMDPAESVRPVKPKVVYTCPMHPEVLADNAGKCPKCGMELILKEGSTHE